jgi:glycerol-3-phosphate dehydrogenase
VGYPATPPHAHLLRYGIDAELIPALGSLAPLMQGHSLSEAELRYVVERQQAVTVTDVLCNRLRTGLENCSLALELGRTLAPQLGALTQQDPQLAAFEHEMQTRLAAIGS